MLKLISERKYLQMQIAEKQRLYAQMLKDNISGPVREKLSEEIGQLNVKLCSYGHRK